MTKAMLIAAPRSGSGKTSVCRGLVAALARGLAGRSLRVRAFKMGPDYLDPLHLQAASGSVCHNLDPWMMGEAACQELFLRNTVLAAPRPDLAVVEGAMGLFDGGDPASNAGSSADLAKLLGIPAVLVVDVAGQARSVAALVKGFLEFDPELRIAGLILNRAGSQSHADLVQAALAAALPEVPVFGCLPERPGLDLPGRHLGLRPPGNEDDGKTAALAAWVAGHLDFNALLAALPEVPKPAGAGKATADISPALAAAGTNRPRIAVSRDAALFFLYEENLDILRAAGADPVFFSPLADPALPEGCCGLYLCGGYPELYGRELSANRGMLESVRAFIRRGGPVYAECGGYMYLMTALTDARGATWPLVGHFPWACRMETRRQALGYREARTLAPSCLGSAGTLTRGHVFHYSSADEPDMDGDSANPFSSAQTSPFPNPPIGVQEGRRSGGGEPQGDDPLGVPLLQRLFATTDARSRPREPEGACLGSVAASYLHVHFSANPDLARNFVAACVCFGAEHGFV